jgi:hypothetical protein
MAALKHTRDTFLLLVTTQVFLVKGKNQYKKYFLDTDLASGSLD